MSTGTIGRDGGIGFLLGALGTLAKAEFAVGGAVGVYAVSMLGIPLIRSYTNAYFATTKDEMDSASRKLGEAVGQFPVSWWIARANSHGPGSSKIASDNPWTTILQTATEHDYSCPIAVDGVQTQE